jgi:hypothetical protein
MFGVCESPDRTERFRVRTRKGREIDFQLWNCLCGIDVSFGFDGIRRFTLGKVVVEKRWNHLLQEFSIYQLGSIRDWV